ncbi:hypothetical protein GJQ54_13850 [Oceanospirillaceae bacterium ASx5O]|nr:hypothetical protein GJQ54_13850 [Oceanospirillaceae bacterium ASx5O]
MKYILIILIALMKGCAAGAPKPPKAAIDYGYENIFKDERHCLSIYKKDDLYYIVSSFKQGIKNVGVIGISPIIRVYSPLHGTAVSIKADDSQRKLQEYLSGVDPEYRCQLRDVPNWRREPGVNSQSYTISAINPLYKNKFDKILLNPKSVDDVIYLDAVLSGYNGYYKNEIVRFDISKFDVVQNTTSQVVDEFLRISVSDKFQKKVAEEIEKDLRRRKDKEEEIAAKKRKNERQARMNKEAQNRWKNRAIINLQRGSKACTFEKNIFGYVEDVTDNRIKLYVVGQVNNQFDGFFYMNDSATASTTKIQSYRWFGKNELRHCDFTE